MLRLPALALLSAVAVAADPAVDALRVTELMYHAVDPTAGEQAAGGGATDDLYDFVELQNIGATTLDLTGVAFTTGITFVFPPGTALAPGAYVVVANDPASFAVRYGLGVVPLGPYAGKFSNGGERVVLKAADATTILDFTYADAWYPATDGSGPSLALLDPSAATSAWSDPAGWGESSGAHGTPGALDGAAPTVATPTFSVPHGLYAAPFALELACATPGAGIHLTRTGAMPTEADETYVAAMPVTGTTVLRAIAVKPGFHPSRVATATYLFPADVVDQSPAGQVPGAGWPQPGYEPGQAWPEAQLMDYGMDPDVVGPGRQAVIDALAALPTFSLVTDLPNLFDPATGIYVNAMQSGDAWERPTSIELLPPTGGGFQIDAGVRIRGSYSTYGNNPKHSFRLFFRGSYGGRLAYPLFGDGVASFAKLDLRCEQNYSWAQGSASNALVREVVARDTSRALGRVATRSRQCHLYINGQYWGIYMTEERPDADFAADTLGGSKDDYDVVKSQAVLQQGFHVEATDGTLDAWNRLWTAAMAGFATDAAYFAIQGKDANGVDDPSLERLVDVDELIDYLLPIIHSGDRDAPVSMFWGPPLQPNNFFAIYDRVHRHGFRYIRRDAEHTLDQGMTTDRTGPFVYSELAEDFNPELLHVKLCANARYRAAFAARAAAVLGAGGALADATFLARLHAREDEVRAAVPAESARWGDAFPWAYPNAAYYPPFTVATWDAALTTLHAWVVGRADIVVAQLTAKQLYGDVGGGGGGSGGGGGGSTSGGGAASSSGGGHSCGMGGAAGLVAAGATLALTRSRRRR